MTKLINHALHHALVIPTRELASKEESAVGGVDAAGRQQIPQAAIAAFGMTRVEKIANKKALPETLFRQGLYFHQCSSTSDPLRNLQRPWRHRR